MDDILLVIIFVILAFAFGVPVGGLIQTDLGRTEAVKHGAAHWVVQPNGSTIFVWNNPLTTN